METILLMEWNRRDIIQRNDEPGDNRPIERRRIETQPSERRMERREVFDRNANRQAEQQPRRMEQPRQRQFEQPQQRRIEQPQQRRVEQPQQRQRSFEPRAQQIQPRSPNPASLNEGMIMVVEEMVVAAITEEAVAEETDNRLTQ